MSAEWFAKLKEFDSLGKMKLSSLQASQEQTERLNKLDLRRLEETEEQLRLREEQQKLQQLYFETEKRLNTSEAQASRLRDIGGDQEKIAGFLSEAAGLESSLFEMLERTEEIQKDLDERKTFLTGLEKTYEEIKTEVEQVHSEEQKALAQIELRMKLILEELPTEVRAILEKTLKKNLAVGSFTRIDNGSCFFCRYKISRTEESEIDIQKLLKTCPQCSRIFIPYGS